MPTTSLQAAQVAYAGPQPDGIPVMADAAWFHSSYQRKKSPSESLAQVTEWQQTHSPSTATPIVDMGVGAYGMPLFRSDHREQPCIVKVAGKQENRGRLESEYRYSLWAQQHNFGPAVLSFDKTAGLLALELFDGHDLDPTELTQPEVQRGVMGLLASIHAAPWPPLWHGMRPALTDFDSLSVAGKLDALRGRGTEASELAGQLADVVQTALTRLRTFSYRPSIVHNDFHHGNVLQNGDHFVAIDWGNTGIGDGARDIAYLVAFTDRPSSAVPELISMYAAARVRLDQTVDTSLTERVLHHLVVIRSNRLARDLIERPQHPRTWWRLAQLQQDLQNISSSPHILE